MYTSLKLHVGLHKVCVCSICIGSLRVCVYSLILQIGSLCMSVVEHELKRHRSLADDVAKRKKEGVYIFVFVNNVFSMCTADIIQ